MKTPSHLCSRAPKGWWCSRDRFHGGPCAARKIVPGWKRWFIILFNIQTEDVESVDAELFFKD